MPAAAGRLRALAPRNRINRRAEKRSAFRHSGRTCRRLSAPLAKTLTDGGPKPPPDRLYGRARGHKLRARQQKLLDVTLPRLTFAPEFAANLLAAFAPGLRGLRLEVGFGGGEHALAQTTATPTSP